MTNGEAKGYLIIAMKNLGYSREETQKVLGALYYAFDLNIEPVALKTYQKFYYII